MVDSLVVDIMSLKYWIYSNR